jgi:hypothetical protein
MIGLAIAVLADEAFLAGEGRRAINSREERTAFVAMCFTTALSLPRSVRDIVDRRPVIRFDFVGGQVRHLWRRRHFRWENVVAIQYNTKLHRLHIRLVGARTIRVGGTFEGGGLGDVYGRAVEYWKAVVETRNQHAAVPPTAEAHAD